VLLDDFTNIWGKNIAKDAITILINLSTDKDVLEYLASDKEFIKTLLERLTVCPVPFLSLQHQTNSSLIQKPEEPNANLLAMLLANLVKWDDLKYILFLEHAAPKPLKSNNIAIDQLLDLFVKGADGTYNKSADFDYLSYVFADLAKHAEGRKYFLTPQAYDGVVPLTKMTVFTEHKSDIRRKGVASTIKNVAFEVDAHPRFLADDEINILPYLLLPITGNETYDEEEMLEMLPDLQLLPPDKKRDPDPTIVQTHVETLTLLTTTRKGRDVLREAKVYPIIRETHLRVENEDVREACDRLVQVLMRDEEGEKVDAGMKALPANPRLIEAKPQNGAAGHWEMEEVEDDDDDKIVEV